MAGVVSADVLINEFLANGIDDPKTEWIEIYNNASSSVDISNWNISDIASNAKNFTIIDTIIPSKGFVILANNFTVFNSTFPSVNESGIKILEYGPSTSSPSLSNTGDTLFLYNSSGYLVDTITYAQASTQENVSIGRIPDGSYNILNLTTLTPGDKNDNAAPVFNKWITPSANNSFITGLINVTVNITDAVHSVNVSLINFNSTNYTMSRNNNLFYYVWDTSLNDDVPYNITIFFNDTLGFSNTDTLFNITAKNNPKIYNPTTQANSRNFISRNSVFNASVNATDANLLNVTCTLNGVTVGNFSKEGDIHKCSLTAPSTENDYTINFIAIDRAGNRNTTTARFTTKYSTTASLSPMNIVVSNLNQSDKVVEVNATLTNAGTSGMYDTGIVIDSFSTTAISASSVSYKSCSSNINSTQSCNVTFGMTIKGGTSAGTYTVYWDANWTNNNLTLMDIKSHDLPLPVSTVTINSNSQITAAKNISSTISHGQNATLPIFINSTGNAALQGVSVIFTSSTLQSSYVSISPSSFTSISAGTNTTFNAIIVIPKYTSPGIYTGNIQISASNAESKTILLTVEVPEDSSWTASPTNITIYKTTGNAGLATTINLNNSGNIGQSYGIASSGSFKSYIWNNSNPTSIYVKKNTIGAINIYHLANGPLTTYDLTSTITSSNTSATNKIYITLVRDNNNPNLNITSPLNNLFVKGNVEFNVTASDLNLSTIEFYINNLLVLNDTAISSSFNWNTTNGSYADEAYTLKAVAYDGAGNFNSSYIDVTVNNTDSNPVLKANISGITLNEGATTTLNLSNYFKSIDGDSLNYLSITPDNITVFINNTNTTVILTAREDFFGIRYIVFYANDTSGNVTLSNNITLTVSNVNDAPATPTLVFPANTSSVFSATGKVTLNWTASTDVDNVALTYYVFYGTNINVASTANTQNTYLTLSNLNNATTYYWKVYASDGTANSANSSMLQFTVTRDDAPAISSYIPTNLTPSVAENSTLIFNVTASDPDGGLLNYTWYVDGKINKTDGNKFNYTPNFTASGTHIITVNVTDNNSNVASNIPIWTVTVTNTNREPVLDAISNKAATEDSLLTFNITAFDPDGDSLTFTSNVGSITFTNAANNSLATVNWTPTNDYVGNNTIRFTASDGSKTDSKAMIITVNNTNDAPTIASFSPKENKTIAEGVGSQKFNVTISRVDAGEQHYLAWLLNGSLIGELIIPHLNPNDIINNELTISNKSKGVYSLSAIITDDNGLEARHEWKLTVTTGMISDALTSPILNLNQSQRENVTNVTINQTAFGGIDFGNNTLNFSRVANLEDAVNISRGLISVDTDAYPELKNKSASIVMKGLNYTKAPLIYNASGFENTNGGVCPEAICTNKTYDNGILRFNVPHFSTYYTGTNTTNGAPVIISTPVTTAIERAKYTYDVDAVDPDGDTLIFSLIEKPNGMSINSNTGLISWTPTVEQLGNSNITVNVSDSNLTTLQSFNITAVKGPRLVISDLDVKVDGKTDKNIGNSTKIDKEAKPGSKVEFKLEIENLFTKEEDLKIEDISAEITIEGIDDGDDIDQDAKEFDLKPGKSEDVEISFDVPLEVDEDVYDAIINIEGEDENGTVHNTLYELQLEVEKEKHEIRILRAALTPSEVKCQRQISISTEIINTGAEDEEDVALEVTSAELGISSLTKGIELDEGTDDNRLAKLVTESISAETLAGIYPITINTYYGGKSSDSKTVDLTVEECELVKEVKKVAREEKPKVEVILPPAIIEKKPVAEVSFVQTSGYTTTLAILIVLFLGTAVFIVGAAYTVLRK